MDQLRNDSPAEVSLVPDSAFPDIACDHPDDELVKLAGGWNFCVGCGDFLDPQGDG